MKEELSKAKEDLKRDKDEKTKAVDDNTRVGVLVLAVVCVVPPNEACDVHEMCVGGLVCFRSSSSTWIC